MLKLKLQYLKRPWCWERLKAGGEGDDRGRDGWMASLTQWTWVWVNSESWWWTGGPGVLRSMGLQRVGHNWATELNWITHEVGTSIIPILLMRKVRLKEMKKLLVSRHFYQLTQYLNTKFCLPKRCFSPLWEWEVTEGTRLWLLLLLLISGEVREIHRLSFKVSTRISVTRSFVMPRFAIFKTSTCKHPFQLYIQYLVIAHHWK